MKVFAGTEDHLVRVQEFAEQGGAVEEIVVWCDQCSPNGGTMLDRVEFRTTDFTYEEAWAHLTLAGLNHVLRT